MKFKIKKNKIYILISISVLFIMIIGFLDHRGLFEILNRCIFEDGFKDNFFLNTEEPLGLNDVDPSYLNIIQHVLFYNPIQFDSNVIFSTNWFQVIIVFYGCLAGLEFHRYWISISNMEIYRRKSLMNYVFSKVVEISIKVSLSVFISFFIFITVLKLIESPESSNGAAGRTLFSDLIGNSLYQNHTYLYFILEGSVRFFLMPFIYSIFSCMAAMLNRSLRVIIGLPIAYYFGAALIGVALYMLFPSSETLLKIANYINPTVIMINGDYNNLNTILMLIIAMIPLYISIIAIWNACHDAEI